jgi:hypothetical protein
MQCWLIPIVVCIMLSDLRVLPLFDEYRKTLPKSRESGAVSETTRLRRLPASTVKPRPRTITVIVEVQSHGRKMAGHIRFVEKEKSVRKIQRTMKTLDLSIQRQYHAWTLAAGL